MHELETEALLLVMLCDLALHNGQTKRSHCKAIAHES